MALTKTKMKGILLEEFLPAFKKLAPGEKIPDTTVLNTILTNASAQSAVQGYVRFILNDQKIVLKKIASNWPTMTVKEFVNILNIK